MEFQFERDSLDGSLRNADSAIARQATATDGEPDDMDKPFGSEYKSPNKKSVLEP